MFGMRDIGLASVSVCFRCKLRWQSVTVDQFGFHPSPSRPGMNDDGFDMDDVIHFISISNSVRLRHTIALTNTDLTLMKSHAIENNNKNH